MLKKLINVSHKNLVINLTSFPSHIDVAHFEAKTHDIRPHLLVKVLDLEVYGLLDTGAVCSILGDNSHKLFMKYGFKLVKLPKGQNVRAADGSRIQCLGFMQLPTNYLNKIKVIKFYIVPNIITPIILGMDFCKAFLITLDSTLNNNKIFSIPDNYINSISLDQGLESFDSLTSEQQLILQKVIDKFDKINTEKVGLGRTKLITHKIDTGNSPPIKQRYYPLSPSKQLTLEKELDRMLQLGVVVPSNSPWNSPVVMVTKPNGKLRLCLDCRKLNAVSKADAYPLPYIHQILDSLRDARYLTSIDLSAAYWQIEYDSVESAEKTAFTVPRRGLFHYTTMSFGLVGASATMQRLMDKLFGPEFDNKVFVFQDDIICISSEFDTHVKLLEKVCQRLAEANLTINMSKSQFCRKELKYLGYMVDKQGLRTDPSKVEVILNYPTPTSPKEVKRFVGMAGWYRRFIQDFSKISRPLSKLTCKNINFEWTEEAEEAFNKLKSNLVSAPILKCPDFNLPFSIQCDASAYAIGAVLTQSYDNFDHPVAFCSRLLNKHEVNYTTTERELLAVLFALEQFRMYVEGQKCNIVTDHASLQWFYKLKNPTGRLARWSIRLSQFDFNIIHRKGKEMVLPDALSRIKIESLDISDNIQDKWYLKMVENCEKFPHKFPNYSLKDGKLFRHSKNKYNLTSQYTWKQVIPSDDVGPLLKQFHDDPTGAHFGIFKTHKRLALHYFWKNMYKDVENYVNNCQTCKEYKPVNSSRPGLMGNPKQVTKPFEAICCDLLGPFPVSTKRNTNLLVCSDYFSKYVMLFPIRNATGNAIVKILEEKVFLVHGIPKFVYVDNGPQFISKQFRDLMCKYNVPNIYYNPRYHPQVNQAERAIRNVLYAIASYVKTNHRQWDNHIPEIQCALNTSVNESTKFSPYFLVHGREMFVDGKLHKDSEVPQPDSDLSTVDPRIHGDNLKELKSIFQEVSKNLKLVHDKNKKHYDLRKRPLEFNVGQIVYKRTFTLSDASKNFTSKLAPRFIRCVISKKHSPVVYSLKDMQDKDLGKFHIKDILKYEDS